MVPPRLPNKDERRLSVGFASSVAGAAASSALAGDSVVAAAASGSLLMFSAAFSSFFSAVSSFFTSFLPSSLAAPSLMKPMILPFFPLVGVVAASAGAVSFAVSVGASSTPAGVWAVSMGAVTAAVSMGLLAIGSSIFGAVSETGKTSASLAGTEGPASFSAFSDVGLVASFFENKLPKIEARLDFFSVVGVVVSLSCLSSFFSSATMAAAGTRNY